MTPVPLHRAIALSFAIAFAVAGAVFLVAPGSIPVLFEWLEPATGMRGMPPGDLDPGLFRALGVAYMYLVTLLAWRTFRRPGEPTWPTLLAHAKFASASLSILLVVAHGPYLVYAANGSVDGLIGVTALYLRRQAMARRHERVAGMAGR
jgi:hypothetical protein